MIDPNEHYVHHNGILLTGEQILRLTQPGKDATAALDQIIDSVQRPSVLSHERLRDALTEYGAWSKKELRDDAENWRRMVWISACVLREEHS